MIALPLALSELVDPSPFLFGGAEVYGFVTLVALGAAALGAVRLAARLNSSHGRNNLSPRLC